MSKTEIVVDAALTHFTFLCEDADKFHLKCSRCIGKARTGLVTVQHFVLGVESFKPVDRPKKWDVCSWQVEVDLSGCCSSEFCKLFVSHSLQECLRDICREDIPVTGWEPQLRPMGATHDHEAVHTN